jgi:hypothetical protein
MRKDMMVQNPVAGMVDVFAGATAEVVDQTHPLDEWPPASHRQGRPRRIPHTGKPTGRLRDRHGQIRRIPGGPRLSHNRPKRPGLRGRARPSAGARMATLPLRLGSAHPRRGSPHTGARFRRRVRLLTRRGVSARRRGDLEHRRGYGIEQLANVAALPPGGALLVAAPLMLDWVPARIYAFTARDPSSSTRPDDPGGGLGERRIG